MLNLFEKFKWIINGTVSALLECRQEAVEIGEQMEDKISRVHRQMKEKVKGNEALNILGKGGTANKTIERGLAFVRKVTWDNDDSSEGKQEVI